MNSKWTFFLLAIATILVIGNAQTSVKPLVKTVKGKKLCDKGWECKGWSVYCCNETISDYFQTYQFENLFSKRNDPTAHASGFWDYRSFITAAALYQPLGFGTSGGKHGGQKEVAAFLGHVGSKTSCGYGVATGGPFAWGLCYNKELSPDKFYCDDYYKLTYPCSPGAAYYGRGAIPIYWNYNYGKIGEALKVDSIPFPRYNNSLILSTNTQSLSFTLQSKLSMAQEGDNGSPKSSPYEEALEALSSLITKRTRVGDVNMEERFLVLFEYLKMLELEEAISNLKIIHVAGTKGKGSTCTFTESILRNCGFRTGLFTSPHLIDIRERFRLDGVEICEEKFLAYFWWCYDRLKEKTDDKVPMPTFFHFLALLAFKIFSEEQVDVCVMEVGLGGKYDATNVVQKPIVCGITSLGYDHMEILGNTLGEIAGEKAGILKHRIPAFTVTQPDEAMDVLKEKASQLNVPLQVTSPLDAKLLNGLKLGLEGEHQYVNAGLAVALCSTWMNINGHLEESHLKQIQHTLPEQFINGLTTASLQGRAQIVRDEHVNNKISNELVFFLDGAHSPESMEACAKWFSLAIKDQNQTLFHQIADNSRFSNKVVKTHQSETQKSAQILLFNCMSVRDPQLLLPHLMKTCADHGVYFKKALFVPGLSMYHKIGSHALTPSDSNIDLSWQFTLQRVWENLMQGNKGKNNSAASEELAGMEMSVSNCEHSAVFSSLPLVINWLRDRVQQNQSTRFQVLVTGSIHLIGDVLKLVKK